MDERTRPLSPRAASQNDPQGSVGPWTIVQPLARGGFGAVFEVRHATTHQRAALKLLHAHLVTSAEMLARFDREIQVVRRLQHPNIVQLIEAGFSEHRPYFVMELVAGEELSKRIARDKHLAPSVALAILEQVGDALAEAHQLGIVHRDIKASNILVCEPDPGEEVGRAVLLDFGIAKVSDALAPELTATNQSLGTPSCMAPEQIQGLRPDARTDVYALGGLLFHMLTGRMPFDDPSATMSQYLHLHARRPHASDVVADISPRLDEVIATAMAIDPLERFSDVRSMIVAARAALRDVTAVNAAIVGLAPAILVSVTDRSGGALDQTLFDDLEGIVPAAERTLATRGFALVLDLGTSALFVARPSSSIDPLATALAVWEQLERRPTRDRRVQVGIAVHREEATFLGEQIQAVSLLRPAAWRLPETIEGVWVTAALDPASPTGRRVR